MPCALNLTARVMAGSLHPPVHFTPRLTAPIPRGRHESPLRTPAPALDALPECTRVSPRFSGRTRSSAASFARAAARATFALAALWRYLVRHCAAHHRAARRSAPERLTPSAAALLAAVTRPTEAVQRASEDSRQRRAAGEGARSAAAAKISTSSRKTGERCLISATVTHTSSECSSFASRAGAVFSASTRHQ